MFYRTVVGGEGWNREKGAAQPLTVVILIFSEEANLKQWLP